MKSYTIELTDELSTIYEDIAKTRSKSTEETLQLILKRVIESMLEKLTADKTE